jgi:hypothetical protein
MLPLIVNHYVVGRPRWTGGEGWHYHRAQPCKERRMTSKTARFRQLIEAEKILIQPGIKDMEQHFLTAVQKRAKYGTAQ